MRLSRRPEPFDSDDYILDRWLPFARLRRGRPCDLISRNGNTFRNFKDLAQWIGENLRVENAVLDGEIACVDDSGCSVFNDLLFRRRDCVYFAFDLLFLNGEDLRALPLIDRKVRLKQLLRRKRSPLLYVDHIERMAVNSSRRSVNSTWRALWRRGRHRPIGRPRRLRRIGSRSRIRGTRRLKATSCSIRSLRESTT
jgi:bifunctional non-homologous end joining protein LigD